MKQTKTKKKKTPQQQKEAMRKRCVAIAKRISKHIEGNRCQYCGTPKSQRMIHSHHIFHEKTYKAMSADVDNLISICSVHHMAGKWVRSSNFNMHGSPRESTEWLIETFPERYAKLKERSQEYVKLDIFHWEKKLKELKELESSLDAKN